MMFKRVNLALIGPPGSGKGSYGRHFAKAFDIPLVTVSSVLKKFRPNLNLSSGVLINDQVVTEALLEALIEENEINSKQGYILDGFPRTVSQIYLMKELWPTSFQIQAALKLDIPDKVCETKILGRRICSKCDSNFSVNGVDFDGFDLPASHPQDCHKCVPDRDWQIREDDKPELVKDRLAMYHRHMGPITKIFKENNQLLELRPYKGYHDIPILISTVHNFLSSHRTN